MVTNGEYLINSDRFLYLCNVTWFTLFFFQSCSGVKVIRRTNRQDRRVVRHAVQTGGHHRLDNRGEPLRSQRLWKNHTQCCVQWLKNEPLADCTPVFQKWASADLNGKFKLPMKNEFIPTNFEIYPLEKDSSSVPTLIKASVAVVLSLSHFLTALEKPPLTAYC